MVELVIGIDCGGTYARVIAADLSGKLLAATKTRVASASKTTSAQENVQNAICDAISRAGCQQSDVVELVAGIAGLDSPEDHEWAEKFTALPGLRCSRLHVNDAVVAHAGALQSQPGIVAISGTGSVVFGVTEAGRHIRNSDFHHYAYSSACYLSYEAVHRVLSGDIHPEDSGFAEEVLAYWSARDMSELRERGIDGFVADDFERNWLFGEMAPIVTEAAQKGVPLARSMCDLAGGALNTGVRLLGNCFTEKTVQVALVGGVIQSDYMQQAMARELAKSIDVYYQIVDPAFPSEIGAVLMGLRRHNILIDESVVSALRIGIHF